LEKYPHFDEHLRRSMLQETEAFFTEMLHENLSVDNFLASDFAMINERLAVHYGVEDVKGDQVRRVKLDPTLHRGGLLGQASVLTATSTDVRTSPVARGAFVLEALLGKTMPFPPANIPDLAEVPEQIDGRPITVAERFAMHREIASRAQCHDRIDPLGLAFENFDAVGRWRDHAEVSLLGGGRNVGSAIKAEGRLPNSDQPFRDPSEFRDALMKTEGDRISCNVTEHMLTYALGRSLEFTDQDAVKKIVDTLRSRGNGLRDLVHLITQSELFRRK
jgi:hypothetical protein